MLPNIIIILLALLAFLFFTPPLFNNGFVTSSDLGQTHVIVTFCVQIHWQPQPWAQKKVVLGYTQDAEGRGGLLQTLTNVQRDSR